MILEGKTLLFTKVCYSSPITVLFLLILTDIIYFTAGSEAGYPSWPPQAHSTSSVESNNPEQSYVEASPDSGIEPSSSDDGHHATQLCKNEVEKPTDPSKKKTPMCLINELARYHKVSVYFIYFLHHNS